jgi:hypothetical protein
MALLPEDVELVQNIVATIVVKMMNDTNAALGQALGELDARIEGMEHWGQAARQRVEELEAGLVQWTDAVRGMDQHHAEVEMLVLRIIGRGDLPAWRAFVVREAARMGVGAREVVEARVLMASGESGTVEEEVAGDGQDAVEDGELGGVMADDADAEEADPS